MNLSPIFNGLHTLFSVRQWFSAISILYGPLGQLFMGRGPPRFAPMDFFFYLLLFSNNRPFFFFRDRQNSLSGRHPQSVFVALQR